MANGDWLREDFLRLEKKVDKILSTLVDAEQVEDHETRIRFLEKYAWAVPASTVTALCSAILAILVAIL
jgi:hypothetical protein